MKKLLSIILAALMIFSLVVPAFAQAEEKSQYPIIRLQGNGNGIYDENGKQVYDFTYDTSNLVNDVVEVCMPNLIRGIVTGDYSAYYKALHEKVSDIYGDAKLDKNGNPTGGTDVSQSDKDYMANASKTDAAAEKGYYSMRDYSFWYDWRLDPMETADKLEQYIGAILETTGKDKVSLYGRCMGSVPIMAYLQKYGSEKLDTVCLNCSVANGCERIGDMFTGNLNLNSDALMRYMNGYSSGGIKKTTGDLFFDIIVSTLRTLNSVGFSEEVIRNFMDTFYDTLGEGIVASFTRAGWATWPSYWALIKEDEYEKAKSLVFGDEGSALREDYAGLIEKLDYYQENVMAKLPEILKNTRSSGTKLCFVANYGFQLFPYVNSYNKPSDQWVSLENASFGATVAAINATLSDEYIKERKEAGFGAYITPDRQVDTSTCLFPDYTWIVKGLHHDDWQDCVEELIYSVCSSSEQLTVNSMEKYPRFLRYYEETHSLSPLTKENMNCEEYYDVDTGSTENMTKFQRLFKIVKELIGLLKAFLNSLFRFAQ